MSGFSELTICETSICKKPAITGKDQSEATFLHVFMSIRVTHVYPILRILLGRNSVIRKALGSTPESEHLPNASKISEALEGDVGLLFTDEEQKVVEEWFESYKKPDFARAGNIALEGFTVPEGAFPLPFSAVAVPAV